LTGKARGHALAPASGLKRNANESKSRSRITIKIKNMIRTRDKESMGVPGSGGEHGD
jgi:hypothetical protein